MQNLKANGNLLVVSILCSIASYALWMGLFIAISPCFVDLVSSSCNNSGEAALSFLIAGTVVLIIAFASGLVAHERAISTGDIFKKRLAVTSVWMGVFGIVIWSIYWALAMCLFSMWLF